MLVKYLGCIEECGVPKPRYSAIKDGLFRVTQPKFLNDRGSEGRVFPYFNQFSPADYDWARNRLNQISGANVDLASDEFLESNFLKPLAQRYGESLPHLVQSQTGHKDMKSYDESMFYSTVRELNHNSVELLSVLLGVISFSRTLVSEHMWIHYASEGRGIAFTFNEEDDFFKSNGLKEVSYEARDRACFTYYKGAMRLNGVPLKSIVDTVNLSSPKLLSDIIFNKEVDFLDFTNRLLFSKSSDTWKQESESRLLLLLSDCDHFLDEYFNPDIDSNLLEKIPSFIKICKSEVVLKRIPFSAFESVVFGENVSLSNQSEIINAISDNSELRHIKIKRMNYDIYGKLVVEDI